MFNVANAAIVLECLLLLAGLRLLWQLELSPAARALPKSAALPRWNIPFTDFLLFLFCVLTGGLLAGTVATLIVRAYPVSSDTKLVIATALSQLGTLGGFLVFNERFDKDPRRHDEGPRRNVLLTGAATFLMAMPVLTVTNLVWERLITLLGLPLEKQDTLRMFMDADSVGMLVALIALACIGAPVTEELIFRAGVFRFTRNRVPRWIALTLPAVIFAALHVNWTTLSGLGSFGPLVALAIFFSIAYERTGLIGTAIIAHALFNLNTVMLLFAGVGPE